MKRLTALICAAALTLSAVPAYANPSSSDVAIPTATSVETDYDLPDGAAIITQEADTDAYENDTVESVVEEVNSKDSAMTVADVVAALDEAGTLPENMDFDSESKVLTITAEDGSVKSYDLSEYNFVTMFADIVLLEGGETSFDDDGNPISVKADLQAEALKSITNIEDYLVMLISPITGELALIEIDPNAYDAETGTAAVELPFLGAFAFIQK